MGDKIKDADRLVLTFFRRRPAPRASEELFNEFAKYFGVSSPPVKTYINCRFDQIAYAAEISSRVSSAFLPTNTLGQDLAKVEDSDFANITLPFLGLTAAGVQALYPQDFVGRVEFYRAKVDTFLRYMHRFQVVAYRELDQRVTKLSDLTVKINKLTQTPVEASKHKPRRPPESLRNARRQTLQFLQESAAPTAVAFRNHLHKVGFEVVFQIPRHHARRIVASDQVSITRIQVLPPPASGQRAVASVMLKGPPKDIHPASAMMKEFERNKSFKSSRSSSHRWGQDTNRPNCLWMVAYNRVDRDDREVDFAREGIPRGHLAWLAGLGNPISKTSVPPNASKYLDQCGAARTKFLRRPTKEHPCHLRADDKVEVTSHEDIGMLPFMREVRRVRVLEEMRATQRNKARLNRPKDDESADDTKERVARRGRLQTKLRDMNDRLDNLRDEMLSDGERIMAYMIYRFNITHFAYEDVKFSPWGKLGGLSKIQRAMIKSPGDLVLGAKILFDRAGVKWPVETIEAVAAGGTSQVVMDESGRKARPDRRMSADWPVVLFWDDKGTPVPVIMRSHVQSAAEVARRATPPEAPAALRPSVAGIRFVMSLNWPEEEKVTYLRSIGIDDPYKYGDGPPP